jgi:hypothetical protein
VQDPAFISGGSWCPPSLLAPLKKIIIKKEIIQSCFNQENLEEQERRESQQDEGEGGKKGAGRPPSPCKARMARC